MQCDLRRDEEAHSRAAYPELMRTALRVACLLLLLTAVQAQNAPNTSHLRHGINASQWFAQVYDPKGYTREHFQTYMTAQDIALMKSMGFDHVRLSVNPQPMFQSGHADQLPPEYVGYLDAAVKMIQDRGLAVILDVHPDGDFKARLANDDFVEQFADFWRALARHYANSDSGMMFFEVLNEPEVHDRFRWAGFRLSWRGRFAKARRSIRSSRREHAGPPTKSCFSWNPCPTLMSYTTFIFMIRKFLPIKGRRGR